ncbi:hypothetical protein Y032_0112g328 [Ancylostoma ceylanicum]|uniref:C3H1-type domain-containing protein n=1 Tax=Ancylostoma ceylanicum TaxID=53326 RepID=A0A016TE58_9BILA|nr:hypothetical protein Y032_0112g328 [Ancylostoma ceylanicum]
MQAAGQIIDPNQYYYAPIPAQPSAAPPGVPYHYAGGFYADPYMVTSPPAQGSQPVMMPVGQPGFIYMPSPTAQVYYSVPTAAPAAATTAPIFYSPEVYMQPAITMPPQMAQPHTVIPTEVNKTRSTVRPLSTSTPLPTEFASIPPPMANQVPCAGNIVQPRYHRNMDHDDVLANLSKISVVSEEHDSTVEAVNEREFERPVRQRRPPPVPSNYKTRMCMTYASGRQCEMGNRCKFAHGQEELRVAEAPQRPPNLRYKTKLCKNFGPYSSNYCPYGLRCEFIHPNDKEYALLCSAPPRQIRNTANAGNGPQNVGDVTPETVCEAPPVAVTRSAAKPAAEKILLKNRNIAGSMVCLATAGRREQASDDSAIGSGSSECGASLAQAKALARARDGTSFPTVPIKFLRRRSMSQFTLKRFNSSENLDVAASCSQLAALEHNRAPMFSPLK